MNRLAFTLATIVALWATLVFASTASSSTDTTPGWIDALTLGDVMEVRGVVLAGKRQPIDIASCAGLRRFGTRPFGYSTAYHRFRCTFLGADGHSYSGSVAITRSILSARPIGGRNEPVYLSRALQDAKLELRDREEQAQGGGLLTPRQQTQRERFLEPYRRAVTDAEAALEPYRTQFWTKTVQLSRVY